MSTPPAAGYDDDETILRRIEQLARGEFQYYAFFEETYGIKSEELTNIIPTLSKWAKRSTNRDVIDGDKVSRFILEQYFTFFNLLPPAQAAMRLGMTKESFDNVFDFAIDQFGIPENTIGRRNIAIRKEFLDRLHSFFPGLRKRTFSDQTKYCHAIHQAFQRDGGISITPLFDPAARLIIKEDPDLAHEIDVVTCGPIGLRFVVWLDFGKPFSLDPDKTSALTFIKYREQLEGKVPNYFTIDQEMLMELEPKR